MCVLGNCLDSHLIRTASVAIRSRIVRILTQIVSKFIDLKTKQTITIYRNFGLPSRSDLWPILVEA